MSIDALISMATLFSSCSITPLIVSKLISSSSLTECASDDQHLRSFENTIFIADLPIPRGEPDRALTQSMASFLVKFQCTYVQVSSHMIRRLQFLYNEMNEASNREESCWPHKIIGMQTKHEMKFNNNVTLPSTRRVGHNGPFLNLCNSCSLNEWMKPVTEKRAADHTRSLGCRRSTRCRSRPVPSSQSNVVPTALNSSWTHRQCTLGSPRLRTQMRWCRYHHAVLQCSVPGRSR